MGCGSQNSTTTTTNAPPPQVLQAYQNLINQGTAVSQLPLQQFQGPTIAGFNPTQQAAFNTINQTQGLALPYINAAAQYAAQGAAPVLPNVQPFSTANVNQYLSPFTQNVTQATQQLFGQQNAQQQQGIIGNAVSQGAWGGDRSAIAQTSLAENQALAENPQLAQIQQQGYNTALQELNAEQQLQLQGGEGDAWRAVNAANEFAGLGLNAENAQLAGASAQLQAGNMGQALEQQELNVPIAQFQQQQAYPFQVTNFLQGLIEGIGPAEGGSAATTAPGPNVLGQVAGLGIAGVGVANQLGAFNSAASSNLAPLAAAANPEFGGAPPAGGFTARGGAVPGRAVGGLVPPLSIGDMNDISAAVAMAGASPVPALAPSGAHPLPFTAPSSVTAGGGGDGTAQTLGTIATIAQVAALASDPALKHVKGKTRGALDAIRRLEVRDARYKWEPPGTERPMMMADNVERVMPSAATGNAPTRGVDMREMVPLLARGIQELDERTSRRKGGLVPNRSSSRLVPELGTGGDPGGSVYQPPADGINLSDPLIQVGAGMMASRSPFVLSQLGESLEAGARSAQASAPHIDNSGDTLRLVYPDGRVLDTGLATRLGSRGRGWQSPPAPGMGSAVGTGQS